MEERQPRKLAVILHADVVGSTGLVQKSESLAHQRIQNVFNRFSETIHRCGGTPYERRGDALVAEFEAASDAVAASLAFQVENTRFNAALEDEIQPTLRIGISLGDVAVADNTVTGDGIVLAQHAKRLADAGGVCITGAIHEAIHQAPPGSVPLNQESLNEQEVAGFQQAVRVFAIRLRDGAELRLPAEDTRSGQRWRWSLVALAVLAVPLLIVVLWPFGGHVVCEVVSPNAVLNTDGEYREPVATGTERSATDLVVLLHAFGSSSADLAPVRSEVNWKMPEADTMTCDLPFRVLSMARPEDVVAQLIAAIDRAWEMRDQEGDPYGSIVLVGHSMGALFARKAYVVASGENPRTPFDLDLKKRLAAPQEPPELIEDRDWAAAVKRIVLLAGMNRGWSISHHMSVSRAALMSIGVVLGELRRVVYGRPPLIFAIRRGAPFITQLRIQWLEMRRRAAKGDKPAGGATTVQLLGSVDDLVSPEDNIDLVSGRDFVYLDVPWSGHADVIEMDREAKEGSPAKARAIQFAKALTWEPKKLEAEQVLPVDMALDARCAPAPSAEPVLPAEGSKPEVSTPAAVDPPGDATPPVTDVLFVIHGIRDEGYWTQKIARRVISKAREEGRCVVYEASSYGYFPMLSFLSSRARREKVEWLMDRYTEARAPPRREIPLRRPQQRHVPSSEGAQRVSLLSFRPRRLCG